MADDRATTLRTLYQEICQTHNSIADFRGKLLTLLPIASGASVFLLLGKLNGGDRKLLLAVGLFGFVVTFGLLMYELRGIEDCTALRGHGEAIEKELGVHEEAGQFLYWPKGKLNLVDEVGAAWIVYVAVLATWLFVALAGLASYTGHWSKGAELGAGLGIGLGALLVVVFALLPVKSLKWAGHDYWTRRRTPNSG
jgi:hypothetical protein